MHGFHWKFRTASLFLFQGLLLASSGPSLAGLAENSTGSGNATSEDIVEYPGEIRQSRTGKETPKLELVGTSQNFSAGLHSSDSLSTKELSLGANIGFFATPHFEPMITFSLSHSMASDSDTDHEYIWTRIAFFPGLVYNLSEDTANSFAFYFSPGIYSLHESSQDRYAGITHSQSKTTRSQFGMATFIGKRFKLAEGVSWYPKINYEYAFENDDSSSSSYFSIIPISFSVLL